MVDPRTRSKILDRIAELGGLNEGVASRIAAETGIPEADIFGAGSFFHLLNDPNTKVRVCQGLSCLLKGSKELLERAKELGLPAEGCSCLAACDRPPALLRDRKTLPEVQILDLERANGEWEKIRSSATPNDEAWFGVVGHGQTPPEKLAMNLLGEPTYEARAYRKLKAIGPDAFIQELVNSGLQGRGGANFPSAFKWKSVRGQPEGTRYVVLNGDEGEPGTFKDRELMQRRPDLVIEGLAMAATVVGAKEVYCYLRGEFGHPWNRMREAIDAFQARGAFPDIAFHLHAGHGAYICGEETALLEALEGKRGMPRLRPPFPTEAGLWQKPTLIHNVETIACLAGIALNGGAWFKALGRTGPGTMLYCVSGHVRQPGVYELPLGVCLDELVEAAGGYEGTLKAFSPGGASSGFLPASERQRPLDNAVLKEVGTMLGSRGLVVLNDTVDIAWAVREELSFFEAESCGQCAPCRIGTRFLRESLDRFIDSKKNGRPDGNAIEHLKHVAEAAWEMNEGSICGLGQAAPLPLTTALKHFPEEFKR